MYNFDLLIDRTNSSSVKYDNRRAVFGTDDLLPMWVADMDFQAPPAIIDAAKKACEMGVFGYTFRSATSIDSFAQWVKKRYDWDIKHEWISSSPGIVSAIPIALRAFTKKGDKVLILTPVYPPFHTIVKKSERELICSKLQLIEGCYQVDWFDFEDKLKSGVKLFILCNSHNPLGRVWSSCELKKMGELCLKYGVLIFSDEIHSDLALFGNKHTVMASLSEDIADITLTAMAPSKTFNIAGMLNSIIVSSSPVLLKKYNKELTDLHLDLGNIFGHITMEAAYKNCDLWLEELITYLEKNITYTCDFLKSEIPSITFIKPQGSFLIWLDFRECGYNHKEMGERLIHKGKIGLNDGLDFGEDGLGFRRMNIGAPLATVKDGLERIKTSLK